MPSAFDIPDLLQAPGFKDNSDPLNLKALFFDGGVLRCQLPGSGVGAVLGFVVETQTGVDILSVKRNGTLTIGGLLANGAGGLGFATGAGGAVTQITSATTGVTLNTPTGQITTVAENIAAAGEVSFTVTNSAVAATDVVVATIASGSVGGTTVATVTAVAAGSFVLTLTNLHASTAETGTLVINFVVIKGVAA